jgi:hypothetical protein
VQWYIICRLQDVDARKERLVMKSWFKVVLVLSLVALVGLTLVGCGGGSGPEATVQGAFKAMEAKDAEKLGSYFTEDIREQVVSDADLAFTLSDKVDISNLKIEKVSQTEDAATLTLYYDYAVTVSGQTNQDHLSDTMDLVKIGGKWLITQPLEE